MASRLDQLSGFEFAAAGNTKLGINENDCFNGVFRGYDDGRELLRIAALDLWHGVLLLLIINSTCHNVVVVSHIQRIGCQPEKNYFTRWPIPLVVC